MAAYNTQSADIVVGKGVKKSLLQAFDDGLVDHETRIGNLAAAANRITLFEYNISPADLDIGDIKHAKMTLAQFQAVNGTGWVLCNGQSSSGSVYASITGQTTVPDLITAKRFVRAAGSDVVGSGSGQIGSNEADSTAKNGLTATTSTTTTTSGAGSHTHKLIVAPNSAGADTWTGVDGTSLTSQTSASTTYTANKSTDDPGNHTHTASSTSTTTVGAGDAETRPINISLNYFIKINLSAQDNVLNLKVREDADINIVAIKGYVIDNNGLPLSSGTFEFDILKSSTTRASLTTIFSTRPKFTGIPTDGEATSSGTFITDGAVSAGDWLQLNVTEVMNGQSGVYIQVFAEPA